MTSKADLTEEEWDLVLEGPAAAGLLVSTAERDGTIRSIPVDVSRAPPDWKGVYWQKQAESRYRPCAGVVLVPQMRRKSGLLAGTL